MYFGQMIKAWKQIVLAASCTLSLSGQPASAESLDSGSKSASDDLKLRRVIAIFRHGARTPVFSSPTLEKLELNLCSNVNRPPGVSYDSIFIPFQHVHLENINGGPRPFSKVDRAQTRFKFVGNCRRGQLTDLGAKQAHSLGKQLLERYSEKIDINPDTIYARSTNIARCVATLSGVLGGLLHDNYKDSVIQAQTMSTEDEIMFPNQRVCAKLTYLIARGKKHFRDTISTRTYQPATELYDEVLGKLDPKVAEELSLLSPKFDFIPLRDWASVLDAHWEELKHVDGLEQKTKELGVHYTMNKKVLENINDVGVNQIAVYYGKENVEGFDEKEKENFRASIGDFVSELTEQAQKQDGPSLMLYSGHDTTIFPLLFAFDIFDGKWPKYCANIVIEVWEDTDHEIQKVVVLHDGIPRREFTNSEFAAFCDRFSLTNVKSACNNSAHEIDFLEQNAKIMEGSVFG